MKEIVLRNGCCRSDPDISGHSGFPNQLALLGARRRYAVKDKAYFFQFGPNNPELAVGFCVMVRDSSA